MKLYLSMDKLEWHIAKISKCYNGIIIISKCNKDTSDRKYTFDNTYNKKKMIRFILKAQTSAFLKIPLHKKNICNECYNLETDNFNQEIIKFKLGIK